MDDIMKLCVMYSEMLNAKNNYMKLIYTPHGVLAKIQYTSSKMIFDEQKIKVEQLIQNTNAENNT